MLCEILSNESLKPNKLKRHFDAKYKTFHLREKDRNFFQRKEKDQLKRQRLDTPNSIGFINSIKQATLASFHMAWLIASQTKPHNIAEKLIKPAAILSCAEMKVQINCAINKRYHYQMIQFVYKLIPAIKIAGLFSIQLDETTDISKDAQLMVHVRYPGLSDIHTRGHFILQTNVNNI